MIYIILLFGLLILLVGAVIIAIPDAIFGPIRSYANSLSLHVFAVVVRLILGIALITYATESRFPVALLVLGWLSIGAAAVLAMMGRSLFKRLMTWALGLASTYGRVAGIFTIVFGAFLVYAVL